MWREINGSEEERGKFDEGDKEMLVRLGERVNGDERGDSDTARRGSRVS